MIVSVARFASVYPLVPARALARPFTYLADGLEKGSVVSVPFGRGRQRGVVVELADEAPADVEPVAVERVLGAVSPALVDLALWLADYYGSTPARALALVAPELPARRAGAARRKRPGELPGEAEPERLTESQERALARITEALGEGGTFLLYGATGSGKTEVYLRACAEALARGLDAIVLVPEIALTPQALGRFRSRFGESVAVLHSGLTEAERRDERERIAAGELGAPRAPRARGAPRAPASARQGGRPSSGGRLSAFGAAPRGARGGRRPRRQGDPPPQPPRRRARAPLPRVRPHSPLCLVRRGADPARGRAPPLPSLRAPAGGARALPGLWGGRARPARRGHRAARRRARRATAGARAVSPRRRRGREPGEAGHRARALLGL